MSAELAAHPEDAPGDVVKRLFPNSKQAASSEHHHHQGSRTAATAEDLERAYECGRWGAAQPSRLFLQAFADALNCLDADPMSGMVSPALMGSHGTIPLTVIAPLADVIRHVSNLIVRAEKEVFFITCSWSASVAQRLVSEALIELSRRAGRRKQRVVVKMMYDKAGPKNFMDSHQVVKQEAYTAKGIQLPSLAEIPNLDFEVISLHKPMLGTLHAKFCVVDRKVAAVMSNNMEDNANMEMMSHLEGPIVDSIYDTALITWNNRLHPTLPSHAATAAGGGVPTSTLEPLYTQRGQGYEQQEIADAGQTVRLPEHMPGDPHYDEDLDGEILRMQSCYSAKPGESHLEAANRQLNLACPKPIQASGPAIQPGHEFTPYISSQTAQPIPMALVSRPPYGPVKHSNINVPQNLSLIHI